MDATKLKESAKPDKPFWESFKLLNAYQIKLLMVLLMLLDHLRYINHLLPSEAAHVFTMISRCVAPMFAYFAVEGILHTRNLKRYCLRLSVLAGIMFAGNGILNAVFRAFSGTLPDAERKLLLINNNVIFTLALGVIAISLIKWGKDKQTSVSKWLYVLSAVCFIIGFLWGEWGTILLPFMFIEYFFRNKMLLRLLGYVLIEIIALLLPFSEPLYFLVFPFILLYNGERGPKTGFSKYFFYIFYPVHLWIIAIINFIVTI